MVLEGSAAMFKRKEWHYGSNIQDRDYLSQDQSFEDLVEELSASLHSIDRTNSRFLIEPEDRKYKDDDPLLKVLRCKRPAWSIQLDQRVLDKFFNGKMGMRAQYYMSPYHGRKKNRLLISKLMDSLIQIPRDDYLKYSGVDQNLLRLSLMQPSAKVWISEKGIDGKKIIRAGDLMLDDQSIQNDWLDVAKDVKNGMHDSEDYKLYCAAINGVKAPFPDQLEIKGSWLTEGDRQEYVTPNKRDRDCQIFMFGFS